MDALAEAPASRSTGGILKGMEVSCIAKATDPVAWTGDNPDVPGRVRATRDGGTVVVEGVIRLSVTEEPTRTRPQAPAPPTPLSTAVASLAT
jgi:hypothetical protein